MQENCIFAQFTKKNQNCIKLSLTDEYTYSQKNAFLKKLKGIAMLYRKREGIGCFNNVDNSNHVAHSIKKIKNTNTLSTQNRDKIISQKNAKYFPKQTVYKRTVLL